MAGGFYIWRFLLCTLIPDPPPRNNRTKTAVYRQERPPRSFRSLHSKALVETRLFSHMAKSLHILGLSHAGQIQARPSVTWPHLARPGLVWPGQASPGLPDTLFRGGGLYIDLIDGNKIETAIYIYIYILQHHFWRLLSAGCYPPPSEIIRVVGYIQTRHRER